MGEEVKKMSTSSIDEKNQGRIENVVHSRMPVVKGTVQEEHAASARHLLVDNRWPGSQPIWVH